VQYAAGFYKVFGCFDLGKGWRHGFVWRFVARTCQTTTKFIRCNALDIWTIRQMHYTRCYQLAVLVIYLYICHLNCILLHFLSVRWGSHTLWQVLVCAWARATCQSRNKNGTSCVWMLSVLHIL
jgi:hypothetical protein